MDNHQQHHQSAYTRPQPQPHQHPANPYAHGSFAEPSLSYGSSDASASDWHLRSDSFSFSNPSNSTGYSSTSNPSSISSFGPSSSTEQLKSAHSASPFSPTLYQSTSPTTAYDPYAYAPTFSAPRFAQPNSGSSLEFNQGRALVEPDTSSALATYEPYGGGQHLHQQQFPSMMGAPQLLDGGDRSSGRRGSSFGMVDGSGVFPESQLSPAADSRSNSFSFSPDPAGVGMMGPPPRPSQRTYSAYPCPQPPSLDTSQLPSNVYGAPYDPTSANLYKGALAPPSPATFSMNPTGPSDPFNAETLGLTMPQAQTKDWTGVYSTTGFDMVSVLAKVASRPNPQIALGPVDLGCSFVVVDAKKWDQPIVFASETFSRLTGYSNVEIIGRNCRFLQAPDGVPVRQGEKRKYTDGNAAHHLRRHLVQGQESQASLINYCKGGKPFINLVTIVPITWDSDEIAYFVGFQVDLVEQPSAIMEKMRDGSYIVNYSLSVNSIPASLEPPQVEPFGDLHPISHSGPMDVDSSGEILRTIGETGVAGLADDGSKKQFNRLLLEHCDDFVHVLSLKGSLLYVSPSAKRLLEYDPSELVGRTLSTICHPSDIVAVLRELKEAGPNSPVNIVYRVRRKNSGYVWLEATGKLHLEQGKGRKCVILVGRPREVYRMSWSDLERLGGFGTTEYWSKLTIGGLYLYSTPSVEKVLGKTSEQMTGTTLAQLSPNGDATEILAALQQAAIGHATTTRHQLVAATGIVDVVTHFYPARSDTDMPTSPMLHPAIKSNALTVIAQTNLFASEVVKPRNVSLPSAPSSRSSSSSSGSTPQSPVAFTLPSFASSSTGSDGDESTGSRSSTSFSAITSTFKQLAPSSSVSDNVFDELDSVRGTSWQFELHQMRLTNKKLREEKEALLAMQRKKRKRAAGGDKLLAPGSSPKNAKRSCANCGRSSSAEWRTGPTGPKTLCNACGLRWSKVRPSLHSNHSSSSGNASASTDSGTPPLIPSMKRSDSRAP